MKQTIAKTALAVAAGLAASACSSRQGYTLSGEVPEVWEGKSVVLYAVDAGVAEPLDSAIIANGRFRMQGELETPRRCRGVIYLDPNDHSSRGTQVTFEVLLDSTEVSARCEASPKGQRFIFSGGASQQALQAFRQELEPQSGEYDKLFDQYVETFYHRADRQVGIDLARRLSQIDSQILARKLDYVRSHPRSGVSLQLFGEVLGSHAAPSRDSLAGLFATIDPRLRASAAGQYLEERLRSKKMIGGEQLPDLEVVDAQGSKHRLRELLHPQGCTLVEVWASWCSPCRDDIPYLREAYAQYHSKGFDIIGISVDKHHDAWTGALEEEKMPWRQFNDAQRESFRAFETGSVPTSILVDGQGRIVRLDARGGWLGADLETMFDK